MTILEYYAKCSNSEIKSMPSLVVDEIAYDDTEYLKSSSPNMSLWLRDSDAEVDMGLIYFTEFGHNYSFVQGGECKTVEFKDDQIDLFAISYYWHIYAGSEYEKRNSSMGKTEKESIIRKKMRSSWSSGFEYCAYLNSLSDCFNMKRFIIINEDFKKLYPWSNVKFDINGKIVDWADYSLDLYRDTNRKKITIPYTITSQNLLKKEDCIKYFMLLGTFSWGSEETNQKYGNLYFNRNNVFVKT